MTDKDQGMLFLRVATPKGVVYEKFVTFVTVRKKDGLMVVNRNYAPVMEKLVDGNLTVHEPSGKSVIYCENGWLTFNKNRCSIYGTEARIV